MQVARLGSISVTLWIAGFAGPCVQAEPSPRPSVTATHAAPAATHAAPEPAPPPAPAPSPSPVVPNIAAITARAPDAFYDPPVALPGESGALLRHEPLKDVVLPGGVQAWRLLYTTRVDESTPATAVATVFAPTNPPTGPRPVIAWEHGTTGLLQKCMPSLVSTPSLGIPALSQILAAGWVVVATDYSFAEKGGPHPYLIGVGEARAALDSVRAARSLPGLSLDTRTVVWGHSQGGHAALWTGIIGPSYAPELEILGVVAIAPIADLKTILALNPAVDKRVGPYLARSYSRFYSDIAFESAIRSEALDAAREMANLCGFIPVSDMKRIDALVQTFDGTALATAKNRALAARLEQNAAKGTIKAPVVIAQGLADYVVLPAATASYVEARCKTNDSNTAQKPPRTSMGTSIEYWTLSNMDHLTIVLPGTPLDAPLVKWTRARFAGDPPARGCTRTSL